MKRIAIIGAGQSGLQLGIGLLDAGYEVTLFYDITGVEIQHSHVMSSQCMFDSDLETELDLGLNYWEEECPKVEGISFAVPNPVGGRVIDWAARLDNFAQSVDQRFKIPRWMAGFQKRGGNLQIEAVDIDDLEGCARGHDLVIVASGKGTIAQLFERDTSRSPFSEPQRSLALTYVRKMRPREPYAAVCFNLIPNIGEYFVFPALTTSGPCEIMVFEGIPGGPMDCWADVKTPAEHLARSKHILATFLPWEGERCRDVELTDENGILAGRFVPTVREPIATLPSGRNVLGMADAIVLNDPLTGQGSNNAARCADIYRESIVERRNGPADAEWMQQTFGVGGAIASFDDTFPVNVGTAGGVVRPLAGKRIVKHNCVCHPQDVSTRRKRGNRLADSRDKAPRQYAVFIREFDIAAPLPLPGKKSCEDMLAAGKMLSGSLDVSPAIHRPTGNSFEHHDLAGTASGQSGKDKVLANIRD